MGGCCRWCGGAVILGNAGGGIVSAYLLRHVYASAPAAAANILGVAGILGGTVTLWIYRVVVNGLRLPRLRALYAAAVRTGDRRWARLLTKILTMQMSVRIGPPLYAAAGLATLWFGAHPPVAPAAASIAPAALEINLPDGGCLAGPSTVAPVAAMVTGFDNAAQAEAVIKATERATGAHMDPVYEKAERVRVEMAGGIHTSALVPAGMKLALGEQVAFIPRHPEPGTICEYIPNMIIGPGG
jgi:hypothetical protein